jgi:phage protein U
LHPTGPAQLAALRAAVRAGSTFMFVMANGDVIGRVAVEKVRETGTHFRKINGAQKISVAITLKATGSRTGGGLGMLFTLF